jgi:pSer/pThr/pTyr-binding forkhead associated (FHA) protein
MTSQGPNARPPPMDFCPHCGALLPADGKFCQSCGAPAVHGAGSSTARPHPAPRVALRIVRADGGPEVLVAMHGEQLVCGRRGDVQLADDPFVAEAQARFFFASGRLAVEDVGGANGVFVRIRTEREVSAGGELRVGRQRLLVEGLPPVEHGPGGAIRWGSLDPGTRFRLVQILEGGLRAAAFPLKEGDNSVGREQGDVTFPNDGFVSGRHAVLHVRSQRLTVRDLGSSNGTFLRLGGPSYVGDGDQFLIGRQLLRVEVKSAA